MHFMLPTYLHPRGQTDACENFTFQKLRLRLVITLMRIVLLCRTLMLTFSAVSSKQMFPVVFSTSKLFNMVIIESEISSPENTRRKIIRKKPHQNRVRFHYQKHRQYANNWRKTFFVQWIRQFTSVSTKAYMMWNIFIQMQTKICEIAQI